MLDPQPSSRRGFHRQTLASVLTFSLLETLLMGEEVLGKEVQPVTAEWLKQLDALGRELKGEKLKQTVWQTKVEQLFERVDLADLLRFVDFEKLTANLKFKEKGERSMRPRFPEVEGLPTRLVFGHQIFALQKGRSVVPHGHDNMATAFLVLQGDFQGRHYDRLEDDQEHMIIKPTIDRPFAAGGYSTVSDHKDNVHWFKASSEAGYIFNIHVLNVEAGRRSGRIYVDPAGEKLAGGKIRARKLKSSEAYQLYG